MNTTQQMPRRTFLRRAGAATLGATAALTAPNVYLSQVRAATGESPNESIRVGLIGVGGQGRSHLFAPSMMGHVQAICDVDSAHLASAKADFEKKAGRTVATYSDYRKMLENKDIDAVLISTPDHWHALNTIDACNAGKDVYVEKPLTLTIAEGFAMIKAARENKRVVQTGSMQRSDAKFRFGCEIIRSGRIGDIKTVRVGLPGVNYSLANVPDSEPPAELDYDMWLGPAPRKPYNKNHVHYNFRFFWDYSGGQMTNWGAHHLDIAQWALGMDESGPVEIEARADFDPEKRYEVPSWFEITYKYANGVKVLCGQSHRMGSTFEGQDGIVYMDRGKLESTVPDALKQPLKNDEVHLIESKNHHQNWFECIKSRAKPICDVEIGHRSATVCHLGNLAVRLGRKIKWDPAKQEIIGDAEATRMMRYTYRAPWKFPEA